MALLKACGRCASPATEHCVALCLDDANFRCDIKGVVIVGEADVCLLLAIRADESVDFSSLDIVHLCNGGLNFRLVSADVDDEDDGVVVFDHLHGALGGKRVFDDLMIIELWLLGQGFPWVLRIAVELERFWPVELDRGPGLPALHDFDSSLRGTRGLISRCGCCSVKIET